MTRHDAAAALVAFAHRVVDDPESVDDADVEAMLAAGFSPNEIMGVVDLVAATSVAGAIEMLHVLAAA